MSASNGSDVKPQRGHVNNRRRGGRHSLDIPATLSAHDTARPTSPDMLVKIVQMSVGGLGLLADRALDLGAVYRVTAFDTLVPAGMQVRVVSVRPAEAPATFVIGAEVV